ncbi:hypothetical protein TREMEDRAFT_22967, partial [Tremella mesenterica DSM 1558]|uniref:uncharacterized protein n=1 Tax=Tremella mesenterica (strain ATCC 24925 / CBS 8224 / DSM 1558 / NBRC 9311 / NRRL Y-6157 / RJB 2259-6 / UBC 559-6) TaxID=578456 RepID=UPI0003F490F9
NEWDHAWDERQKKVWAEKVRVDLEGWRGGHGTNVDQIISHPRSTYSRTAVPSETYFGQPTTGIISRHLPKEILRIERDWSEGEVCQFEPIFPMELEGRISPSTFQEFIRTINAHLTNAYSVRGAVVDNLIAVSTWWTSLLWRTSHFEKKHLKLTERSIERYNKETFEPVGLRILSPRHVALQFV